jgi:hypothetical protein
MQPLLMAALLATTPQADINKQPQPILTLGPRYAIESKLARQIEATMTWDLHTPKLTASEWIIYAPFLPNITGRQSNVSSTMNWSTKTASELGPLHQTLLLAQVPVNARMNKIEFNLLKQQVNVKLTYKAHLYSRDLVELAPDARAPVVPNLTAKARSQYLAASDLLNFKDKDFQKWLDTHKLRKGAGESEIDFGKRVYKTITKGFTYYWKSPMDWHVTAIIQAGKSDCGGLASVFVSALRANGVPARLVTGRWAFSANKSGGDPYQYHVKAEFFAAGVGWVPADLSSGLNDKSKDGLAFFGHETGDFLVLHFDNSLVVDTLHFGKQTVTWLQMPAIWATGNGTFDNSSTTEGWQVKNMP